MWREATLAKFQRTYLSAVLFPAKYAASITGCANLGAARTKYRTFTAVVDAQAKSSHINCFRNYGTPWLVVQLFRVYARRSLAWDACPRFEKHRDLRKLNGEFIFAHSNDSKEIICALWRELIAPIIYAIRASSQ